MYVAFQNSAYAADIDVSAEYPFNIETTADTTEFSFNISARGNFLVDCGDGGRLSGESASESDGTITRTNTTNATYTCTWDNAGAHTVKFGGHAMRYSTGDTQTDAAISFWKNTQLAGIYGSIGAIFGTIDPSGSKSGQPQFFNIFRECPNLTSTIPHDLFHGVRGQMRTRAFMAVFQDSGFTGGIPADLFADVNGAPVDRIFAQLVCGCTGLTGEIPSGLFAGIHGAPAVRMFVFTFNGCSGLTGNIPDKLFGDIRGAPAKSMFESTFDGCSGLTGSIPPNLFSGISGAPQERMYGWTFFGCSGLTGNIPDKLFGDIRGAPAENMFYSTFNKCSGLTGNIPDKLFGDISGAPATDMFAYTFYGCSNLTGYVPYGLFDGIDGVGTDTSIDAFNYAFGGTSSMDTECPAGTVAITKPYSNFGPAAFCEYQSCPTGYVGNGATVDDAGCYAHCPAGTYVPTAGAPCTDVESGYYAPESVVQYGETSARNACPVGLTTTGVAGRGADEAGDCGRVLHIGDGIMHLRSEKRTSPTLCVQVGDDVFYGDMRPLSDGARGKLRTQIGNTMYSVYNMDLD